MNFIEELKWRGMLQDYTPGIEEILDSKKVTAYIGFDPTAPSLTIGNYVQIMILKLFQLCGHQPIVLMGGATGRIGDPSGKDKERELKSYEELDRNLTTQMEQFKKLLDFETAENPAIFVNNLDFYKDMNVLEFLRTVGKNLTINYMLSKESVKKRVEIGMSYTEFSYQLLQAYDFLYLYKHHNCRLQMGGSDQWGNITSGTEFIRRNIEDGKAYALTTPLLTRSDGKKFGKSEQGNIWLDPTKTSPYHFFQFWINSDDQDLKKYFRYFSLKSRTEIDSLENEHADNPNALKRILAEELTCRIHSVEDFESVIKVSEILFNHKLSHDFLVDLSENQWIQIAQEVPSTILSYQSMNEDTPVTDFVSTHTELFQSNSEVRRAIQGNALSINKQKITDFHTPITNQHLINDRFMLIENGKKKKHVIVLK